MILIVAIWRKWQYTGLNCDIAYTHGRVREVAFRFGKKTTTTQTHCKDTYSTTVLLALV